MARPKIEINAERGNRLKELIETEGKKQYEFAKIIHISQQALSKIINGKANLTAERAAEIIEKFPDYNYHWLMADPDYPRQLKKKEDLRLAFYPVVEAQAEARRDKHIAIKNIVECCGYSVEQVSFRITIRKNATQEEVRFSEPVAHDYAEELMVLIRAFVDYHFLKRKNNSYFR